MVVIIVIVIGVVIGIVIAMSCLRKKIEVLKVGLVLTIVGPFACAVTCSLHIYPSYICKTDWNTSSFNRTCQGWASMEPAPGEIVSCV